MEGLGKLFVILGVILVGLGGVVMLLGRWPGFSEGFGWLGRLPGDIHIRRENFTFYFPLATSVLLSVVVSLLLLLISFLSRR